MEFKSHQKSRTKGNQERINRIIMEFKLILSFAVATFARELIES